MTKPQAKISIIVPVYNVERYLINISLGDLKCVK